MGQIDSGSKSNRLLASRRYTHNTLNTSQEAFTNVLDLRSEEIYTRAHLIPSSSLPHSGSSQKNAIFTKDGQNVTKYWYRHCLTKSNVNNEVFFFLSPTGSSDGIGPQLIDDNQQTNFISPKYSVSSLANATTEDATPGYLAIVYKSTTTNTASLGGGDIVSTNDYQFDYKTGVLQFKSDSVDPTDSQKLYMTVYQYVGQNLRTGLEVQGPVTASSFSGTFLGSLSSSAQIADDISGSFVAASSSFSTRISTAESELTNTLVSSSAQIASDISGSWRGWASGSNEHLFGGSVRVSGDVIAENYIVSSSITYLTQSFSSGSNIFGDTGDDTHKFTGSLFVNSGSQDLLVVSSSGRIGIGTLEPGTTVEIVGSVSSSATGSFQHLFVGDRITLNDNQDSGEYIESDGTDININVGTNGDVNIPANIGLTFGNDGEKIEGDGTDLTIASSGKLALDVTTDLEIDVDGGDIKITDDGAHVADISATAISGSSVSTGSFGRIEVDKLEADTLDTTISNLISGSLGANASLIRSLTATTITGSFTAASSSFSTRITTAETELSNTLVSSSAQIADDISGSFTAASSSFSTRISTAESELTNTLVSSSAQIADDISGSFTAASSSFSTRISTAESELTNTLVSSSAQIASDISGSFTAASSSFSTRISTAESELTNTLVSSSAQIASDISGSFTAASSSFSTRISTAESELTNTLVSSSAQIASDISGSFTNPSGNVSGSATSTGSFGKLEVGSGAITTTGNMTLDADGAQIRLEDGGTEFGRFSRVASDFVIKSMTGDKDLLFKGVDDTTTITALKLDMSEGGDAEFSGNVSGSATSTGSFGRLELGGNANIDGNITLGGSITIGDADTDDISIGGEFTSHLIPNADSTFDLGSSSKNWRFGYIEQVSATHVTASGHITGSSTSTGSFGRVEATTLKGDGSDVTNVTDPNAIAFSIVFGG